VLHACMTEAETFPHQEYYDREDEHVDFMQVEGHRKKVS
jgi:hypothetical protein